MIERTERQEKRFVHCPVCGRCIMKAAGDAEIEMRCDRCGSSLAVIIRGGMVSVLEDRRERLPKRPGAVSVSVPKGGNRKTGQPQSPRKAACF